MKEYFETISDPRQAWKIEYSLLEIVIMTICAVISNCDDWEDIVDFRRSLIPFMRLPWKACIYAHYFICLLSCL
jgi:hypothetical protein